MAVGGQNQSQLKTTLKKPLDREQKNGLIALVVVAVIAVIGLIGALVPNSHPSSPISYSVSSISATPIDAQELSVNFEVTNNSKSSGIPNCGVSANSPGGADSGFDDITPVKPIRGGHSIGLTDNITITNNGAFNIDLAGVKVSC
jgi:hypothetical protein